MTPFICTDRLFAALPLIRSLKWMLTAILISCGLFIAQESVHAKKPAKPTANPLVFT